MSILTSGQRRYLRAQAHHLQPVCFIGKNGITDALVSAVNMALDDHELIKVKFVDQKEEKKTLAPQLAELTKSELAGIIGNIAILYRQQSDEEKRTITLPD